MRKNSRLKTPLSMRQKEKKSNSADHAAGHDPDGESVTEVTVPFVPSAQDYRVRIVSVWNPAWFTESHTLSIRNPKAKNAISPENWVLYR